MDRWSDKDARRLEKRIRQRLRKALNDYHLIEDGDRILIGLSGGKDSIALLQLLAERSRIHVPSFSLVAAHISVENIGYRSDLSYLEQLCQEVQIPFVRVSIRFDETLEPGKSKCFLCSWYRRKALFDTAQRLGCNKLALGHHMDDIVETFLLNMTYQGTLSTMPPKLKMDKFNMTVIRPLCLNLEADLRQWATIHSYRKQIKSCPYETKSSRNDMKHLLEQLTLQNPHVLSTIWRAMENIRPDYLPKR